MTANVGNKFIISKKNRYNISQGGQLDSPDKAGIYASLRLDS